MFNFRITGGKGFQFRLANEVIISVQFGGGNYGSHHGEPHKPIVYNSLSTTYEALTAEIAVRYKDEFITRYIACCDNDVEEYISHEEFSAILAEAMNLTPDDLFKFYTAAVEERKAFEERIKPLHKEYEELLKERHNENP